MKHIFWIVPLALLGVAGGWLIRERNAPPEVRFTVAALASIVDTLATNGKVEPAEYASLRAVRAGTLTRLTAFNGKTVAAGQVVAELDNTAIYRSREAAEARVAQLEAELRAVSGGGRASERADIDGQLRRLDVEHQQAQSELERVTRLIEKHAATRAEAQTLRDRVHQLDSQRTALQQRRSVLFTSADRAVIEARLAETRAAAKATMDEQDRGTLRAPISGTVYQLDLKPGAFLNPGDFVANIGDVSKLVVKVFVDEPELSRVAPGMPVTITWDGRPGREWKGEVRRMPVQILPLQSRQVGEVVVRIENEDGSLPAGANVNAAIRSREAANAVVVPKECLRRDEKGQGVFVAEGATLHWRSVQLGVTNVTHAQITSGVKAGDRVLLATETLLRDKQAVRPAPGQ
ncbi:MAG: efflux RND transporter periplasmic adaptor subunit [Acidobacteria bacterium]|nr:efflux RND transporter periplasmic adaptor subunit [Acidobacteriota bacterium]